MIDFNIDKGLPIKSNDIEMVLQQIDLLFDTIPTEVLGSEDFGTKYDTYLYDLNISASNLEQQVYSDLYSLDLLGFVPEVEVHLYVDGDLYQTGQKEGRILVQNMDYMYTNKTVDVQVVDSYKVQFVNKQLVLIID